ncbi:ribonucleoside-diphosphate reductase, adenosylcobalamin-dependent [Candidatus Pacearchaeota archaeon ex4484_71]|nr:MAG: ribonucleoside-diphosphate reductase, adenosylcobalamin-dependent [Candidatus Pacearchaeota archaeon ex4484_71]
MADLEKKTVEAGKIFQEVKGVPALGTKSNKGYLFPEVFEESKKYFGGDDMVATNWARKYALKDPPKKSQKLEEQVFYEKSPTEMHERLINEFERIESKYENPLKREEIEEVIKDFKYFIPGGSVMSGMGNNIQVVSLSNCFVIGDDKVGGYDSYGWITKIDQEQIQLMKRRGGVGHDLSHLRPAGSPTKNSALTSTGVVSFMERYSNSTLEVAQDGRRGALMLSLSIKHPDAERFIDAKLEKGKVTGANISVKIDDEFMEAVKNGEKYTQQFPIDSKNPSVTREIDAKELWDKIIYNAWKSAEPGVLFWDTILRESVPDSYADLGYRTTSTNPCGEIPLTPHDSCRLGALNLYNYVINPFTDEAKFDFEKFKRHVHVSQKLMDDIIDAEAEHIDYILQKIDEDPEPEEVKSIERNLWSRIKDKTLKGRRTGLGITGEGDMLAALGLRYGTPEATEFSVEVHKNLAIEAYRESVELAKERGAFEVYDAEREKDNPFISRIREEDPELYEEMTKSGRRNIALLTIAPTGTVSQMAQTSSGIEPVFDIAYERRRKINPGEKRGENVEVDEEEIAWEKYKVFHPKFEEWLKVKGYDVENVKGLKGEELEEIIKKSPYYKARANDVDYLEKVRMQGKIQKWVDHSISVTVNLPEDVDEKLVSDLYMEAWKTGCKGLTIYREGSREAVISRGKSLENIVLVQKNVAPHPLLDIKPQAMKYSIKRPMNGDRLHIVATSDLYIDDKKDKNGKKKAYFLPDEDFQSRLPLGTPTSVSFTMSGIDRSRGFRGDDPDYVEFLEILQSAYSSEMEGMGPNAIRSIDHAVGLAWEHYLLMNGVVDRDPITGKLFQVVRKKNLRKVKPGTDEYNAILSQVRISGGDSEENLSVSGNNRKLDNAFVCENCGSRKFTFKDGCPSPVCAVCGNDNGKGCGS